MRMLLCFAKLSIRKLAVTFGEGGSASNCEPRRKGTINHHRVLFCILSPIGLTSIFISSTRSLPLLSLCDISSVSTEEFTPEGGSNGSDILLCKVIFIYR